MRERARDLGRLDSRDQAFVRRLVLGTLRRFGQSGKAAHEFLAKPLAWPARRADLLLRLGATEILYLDGQPHAAVNSAVAVASADPKTRPYRRLVNAVLRRVADNRQELLDRNIPFAENLPEWLRESWTARFGDETTESIASVLALPAPLDLTCRVTGEESSVARDVGGTVLPNGTVRCSPGGSVEDLPGFQSGDWWVQDAAASLPVRLLGDVRDKLVLDLCAAPGGKSLQLASAGARLISVDHSQDRLRLVEENFQRTGFDPHIVACDAADFRSPEPAPAILLDAPCTATGISRRHPDIRFVKSVRDVAEMAAQQHLLLKAAAEQLPPGGLLVYCVCSLQAEEGPDQVHHILQTRRDLKHVPITADDGVSPEFVTPDGHLQTLPCHWAELGGLDGFFAARLRKST